MAVIRGMEGALSRLLADYSLSHYEHALEELGLKCVADLPLMEDEDLLAVGMQRIQRRAFSRLCEDAAEHGAELRRAAGPSARARGTQLGPRCSAQEPLRQPLLGDPPQPAASSSAREAEAPRAKLSLGQGLAAAAADAARGAAAVPLGRDAAAAAQSLAEALSLSKAAAGAKRPAAPGQRDGEASPLPRLLGQRAVSEKKEQQPQCVILDGRLVTPTHKGGWCESQCPQQQGFLSVQQLRAAFDWFKDQLPNCRVRVLLCGARKDQWRDHPLLRDIGACLIWKPSGYDVDRFLVEVASRGLDHQRVQVVTNCRFQRLLGASVCEKTINAGWVEQHTIRFAFSGAAFRPALTLSKSAGGAEKPKRHLSWLPFPLKMSL